MKCFAELERQIMDSREPKNEREWWAAGEIESLRLTVDNLRALAEEYRALHGRERDELMRENARMRKLEAAVEAWLAFQSSANSHALYCAAMEHFGRTPVLPD